MGQGFSHNNVSHFNNPEYLGHDMVKVFARVINGCSINYEQSEGQ